VAQQTGELAQAVEEVTARAQSIVRDEIELAKAEVAAKASKLAKGAAVGAAAGIFVVAGLIYFLHFAAWGLADVLGNDVWLGYLIVTVLLFLLAAIGGLVARKLLQGGSPPTPQMAIEEAHKVRDTISAAQHAEIERPPS
jgi:hypothetical protein